MPNDIKEFYYSYPFQTLNADREGIGQLLAFKADIAIIEPTGMNYSRVWYHHLLANGVEVRFVDHTKLRYYRERHLELPNKDDDADALALATYGLEHLNNLNKFITARTATVEALRRLVLRLMHINRVRTPLINRVRQDLCWQFPEVAFVQTRSRNASPPILWRWLAGNKESIKYESLYKNTIGLGVTSDVKLHCDKICAFHCEEYSIESQISEIVSLQEFEAYRKVFSKFHFGLRTEALILTQIYPFNRFLENNQPIIKVRKGRVSGKPTARHLSERRFLKTLGLAPTQEYSGDSKRVKVKGGSALSKKLLWLWVFSGVEPKRCRTVPVTQKLGKYLDELKLGGKPVQLARSKTAALGCKLLFRELVKELCN